MLKVEAIQPELMVLVVDDDPLAVRLVTGCLRQAGYHAEVAVNGWRGLELLRCERPVIVIVDRLMPGMDGLELCRRIRRNPRIPFAYVVMLTACGEPCGFFDALEAGADDFLTKPFDPEELIARVRVGHRLYAAHVNTMRQALVEQERDTLSRAIAAMEETLGVIAHELRTPLTGFGAILDMMAEIDDRSPAEAEHIRLMEFETGRMARLVDRLLIVGRCQAGCPVRSFAEFDVSEICQNAAAVIESRAAQRNNTLRVALPESLTMRGDRDAVEQVLLNLLNNAISHASSAEVSLSARVVAAPAGDMIEIEVADTGPGMKKDALELLREALAGKNSVVEVARMTRGGFGLAICRDIAAAHNGAIAIDSQPGRGTTVHVRLRRGVAETTERTGDDSPSHAAPRPALRHVSAPSPQVR